MEKLLSRDEFRERVLKRHDGRCCLCENPAVDAHHILERRLWPDGGYWLSNGANVCGSCHLKCESTEISVETVRDACGITKPVLPPHLYDDQVYDKWGNIILSPGRRIKGELFFDESVQKIIKPFLGEFISHIKYPRTFHLPWSDGCHGDDRMMKSIDQFRGQRVVVTVKMDGENTSCYRDYIHARSLDSRNHPSRNWVKNFWSGWKHEIPEDWRICGENLYAEHSIRYNRLESYFQVFSIWNAQNECLSWDETLEWCSLLDLTPVRVLYDGTFDEHVIKGLWKPHNYHSMEGYVVRLADCFKYRDFQHAVGKFVRKGHVATTKHHWMAQEVIPNALEKDYEF